MDPTDRPPTPIPLSFWLGEGSRVLLLLWSAEVFVSAEDWSDDEGLSSFVLVSSFARVSSDEVELLVSVVFVLSEGAEVVVLMDETVVEEVLSGREVVEDRVGGMLVLVVLSDDASSLVVLVVAVPVSVRVVPSVREVVEVEVSEESSEELPALAPPLLSLGVPLLLLPSPLEEPTSSPGPPRPEEAGAAVMASLRLSGMTTPDIAESSHRRRREVREEEDEYRGWSDSKRERVSE